MRNFFFVLLEIAAIPLTLLSFLLMGVGAIGTLLALIMLFFLTLPMVLSIWIRAMLLAAIGAALYLAKNWITSKVLGS